VAWDANGAGRQLPAPAGSAPGSSAIAIRDGWVVGHAGGPAELARWNLRTGDVGPVPGLVWLKAVNRQGWVAGFVRDGSGYETPAFVVGETVVRLPSVDGAVRSREGPGAFTISDRGTVLAGILLTGSDQASVAVRWTCR
jgi:hypothetical protein